MILAATGNEWRFLTVAIIASKTPVAGAIATLSKPACPSATMASR
jgi:hypothetical protein